MFILRFSIALNARISLDFGYLSRVKHDIIGNLGAILALCNNWKAIVVCQIF